MSLIGDLGDLKIGDVLRVFATGRKTGLLTVAAGGQQASLHFQKGTLVHAAAGRLRGEEAVIDVFGWKEGQLTFVPEERTVMPNVSRPLDALILDGLRLGETAHRMQEVIPSDRVTFQMAAGPKDPEARVSMGAAEWKVLRILDGVRDVREVVDGSKLPKGDVMRILLELAEAGFVERVEPLRTLRVQAQGMFGRESADIDERIDGEWRRIARFAAGVTRVEVRTLAGKTAQMPVAFRAGLIRDVHLPRNMLATLGLREGEEIFVRPAS